MCLSTHPADSSAAMSLSGSPSQPMPRATSEGPQRPMSPAGAYLEVQWNRHSRIPTAAYSLISRARASLPTLGCSGPPRFMRRILPNADEPRALWTVRLAGSRATQGRGCDGDLRGVGSSGFQRTVESRIPRTVKPRLTVETYPPLLSTFSQSLSIATSGRGCPRHPRKPPCLASVGRPVAWIPCWPSPQGRLRYRPGRGRRQPRGRAARSGPRPGYGGTRRRAGGRR